MTSFLQQGSTTANCDFRMHTKPDKIIKAIKKFEHEFFTRAHNLYDGRTITFKNTSRIMTLLMQVRTRTYSSNIWFIQNRMLYQLITYINKNSEFLHRTRSPGLGRGSFPRRRTFPSLNSIGNNYTVYHGKTW